MLETRSARRRTPRLRTLPLVGLALAGLIAAPLVSGSAAFADPTDPGDGGGGTVSPAGSAVSLTQPLISGTAAVGRTLSATSGDSDPAGAVPSYQWDRDGQAIDTATSPDYVVTASDLGATITVVETASATGYTDGTATSDPTEAVVRGTLPIPATPTIGGAARVSATLTASTAPVAGTPTDAKVSWSWSRSDVTVPSATSASYPVTEADRGLTLSAVATVSAPGYVSSTSLPSEQTAVVVGPNSDTLTPSITGTPLVGKTLLAHAGASVDVDAANLAYQWRRSGAPIAHATSSSYRLTTADAGHRISFVVTDRPPFSDAVSAVSASTATVLKVLSARPAAVVGTRQVGHVLTAVFPTWSPAATGHSYRWLRNGKSISGATKSKYTLTGSDAGKSISVTITGTRSGYKSVSLTTKASSSIAKGAAPKSTKRPHLAGTSRNGHRLTVTAGSWSRTGLTAHYTWYRSGAQISGASSNGYTLTPYDIGRTITARVTVTRTGYANGTVLSNKSSVVTQALATLKGDGTFRVGQRIAPGTYWSSGGGFCYWERLSSANGSFDSIITNDIGTGQRMITIHSSDRYVSFDDCGSWYPISTVGPGKKSIPSNGTFKVGKQIAPGEYKTTSSSCYWARLSSTDGSFDSIIANRNGSGYLTVESGDYAISTDDCGTMTRVG